LCRSSIPRSVNR